MSAARQGVPRLRAAGQRRAPVAGPGRRACCSRWRPAACRWPAAAARTPGRRRSPTHSWPNVPPLTSAGVSADCSGYHPSRRSSPELVTPDAPAVPRCASATASASASRRRASAGGTGVAARRRRRRSPGSLSSPLRACRAAASRPAPSVRRQHRRRLASADRLMLLQTSTGSWRQRAVFDARPEPRPRRLRLYAQAMSGFELGAVEARILGCLMEKQRTTPDAYPLSLNAAAPRVQPDDEPRPGGRIRRHHDPRRAASPGTPTGSCGLPAARAAAPRSTAICLPRRCRSRTPSRP